MQLNCETEELKQMALLMFGEKISALEQRIAELEAQCAQKDEVIAILKSAIEERDDKIEDLQNQIVELGLKMNQTAMTTWALQQFLVLSKPKAKIYVKSVDNGTRAQLGQFMFQSLPDNAPSIQIDYVRAVTQPEPPEPALKVDHADLVVGLAEDGSEIYHHREPNKDTENKEHGRE